MSRSYPLVVCALLTIGSTRAAEDSRGDGGEVRAAVTPSSECSAFLRWLQKTISAEERHHIRLGAPPVADRDGSCANWGDVADGHPQRESGTINGHSARASRAGPGGSGHFWDVRISVALGGKKIGACLSTSTGSWRFIPEHGTMLFDWHALSNDRFVLWADLATGPDTDPYNDGLVLLPLIYKLKGTELVLDRPATLTEIDRFGSNYAKIAADESLSSSRTLWRGLHVAAAEVYREFAAGASCERL
jgi:hypothetical protein